MKLKTLTIARAMWGVNVGKLEGSVEFEQEHGNIKLILTDDQMAGILNLCAPAIVQAAQVTANLMLNEIKELVQIEKTVKVETAIEAEEL
jgi:NAD dependent epimerase/dehydratase family enzyme